MTKIYIIQRLGSEYNDEVYRISEDGKPIGAFKDLEKAKHIRDLLEYQEFKGLNLLEYGYDPDEVLRDEKNFIKFYNAFFKQTISLEQSIENCDLIIPESISMDQFDILKDFIKLRFYEITPVDSEDFDIATGENQPLRKAKMKNQLGGANKVWNIYLYEDDSVVTEWGKPGVKLQTKTFPKSGKDFYNKKLSEKIKKGYIYV